MYIPNNITEQHRGQQTYTHNSYTLLKLPLSLGEKQNDTNK